MGSDSVCGGGGACSIVGGGDRTARNELWGGVCAPGRRAALQHMGEH